VTTETKEQILGGFENLSLHTLSELMAKITASGVPVTYRMENDGSGFSGGIIAKGKLMNPPQAKSAVTQALISTLSLRQ